MANLKPLSAYGKKLLDPRWQKVRLEVLSESNFTCVFCGDKETTLHVHHLCYNTETKNPWDVDKTALLCLCENCHKIQHLNNLSDFEKEILNSIHYDLALVFNGTNETVNRIVRNINTKILNLRG